MERSPLSRVYRFLASNGLATIVLLLLLLITFLGTLEQTRLGIYEVQKKYFESMYVIHWVAGAVPILLPGALLLLVVFTVNILLGGFAKYVKAGFGPKGPYFRVPPLKIGVLIAHLGIVFLLLAGFLSLTMKTEGVLTLFEGERSDEFVSHYDWEIAVWADEGETVREHLVPGRLFERLAEDETRTFTSEDLPFDLSVVEQHRNCDITTSTTGVDGFRLRPLDPNEVAEMNIRGARVVITDKTSGESRTGLLWGRQRYPYLFLSGGRRWAVDIRKVRHSLPFSIRLEDFRMERHPGTSMPSAFSSQVTRIQDDVEQPVLISMNKPLRHQGYTLYQSSWGPQDAGPRDRLYSGLAVAQNPAEHLPLYATIVITLGLLVHFVIKLARYLVAERARTEPVAAAGAGDGAGSGPSGPTIVKVLLRIVTRLLRQA